MMKRPTFNLLRYVDAADVELLRSTQLVKARHTIPQADE